jgi:ATP-binding cassette, subfamily B, bacterial PglK
VKGTFQKLWSLFDRRERLQFAGILGLTFVGAIAETFGVGLIPSFVGLLSSPRAMREVGLVGWAYQVMGFTDYKAFVLWACFALMAIYLLKNLYLAGLAYLHSRFIYSKQARLSEELLASYLNQPYVFHLQRNSAELLRNINVDVPAVFNEVMRDVLIIITEAMIALCITLLLMAVEPISSIVVAVVLGVTTWIFYRLTRDRLGRWGTVQQRSMGQMLQWVNQSLGGIKETQILGREAYFAEAYGRSARRYGRAMGRLQTVNKFPRLFIETIAVISLLLVLALDLMDGRRPRSLLLLLSLFAAAAFRLMVALNRIVAALTTIRYFTPAVDGVYADLQRLPRIGPRVAPELAAPGTIGQADPLAPLTLRRSIELRDVSFTYPDAPVASLDRVSLRIQQGEAVALVGPSGAGKTTIVDVLLGLLAPSEGGVWVDDQPVADRLPQWQRQLGYIPQRIYLADDSLRRNIAFGVPDRQIDDAQIWRVLELAQLSPLVRGWPQGLDTLVGEQGQRLSGGQRQRMAIARALYPNPQVLVLDEATAALDNETERAIVTALESLRGEKTLITIAHRLSTIKHCDRIYFIKDGQVHSQGTYGQLMIDSPAFQAMVAKGGG